MSERKPGPAGAPEDTGAKAGPSKKVIVIRAIFALVLLAIAALPSVGPGGKLSAAILACALLGVPLFALIGIVTVLCFLLYGGRENVGELTNLIERIRTLADADTLLAVPLFMMSGAVMSRGQISARLIEFAKALVGWMPGGLAVSAVFACMLFAAISGSSPATVVAIGAMMGPTLIDHGYGERFSHGLLTTSGSLGILIPPSIPMVLYPLVNPGALIEVERLFAAGVGPGLVMGAILMGFSIYQGVRTGADREPFKVANLGTALLDGFWSLLFPLLILGGIYGGIFTAVEASAISVVYAIAVEVWIHRALTFRDLASVFEETGIFLGSLLVIMVAALSFSEFLEDQQIPRAAVEWIQGLNLTPFTFLLILNLLLLIVGTLMDILSAMFIFVPLLAPIAASMGIDPMHFGIIFIVNLEIGYLTPPVGLNLFVASTLFERPLGHMIKAVSPFIVLMLGGLALITYVPAISIGLSDVIMGPRDVRMLPRPPTPLGEEPPRGADGPADPPTEGVMSLEEMMRQAQEGGDTERSVDPDDRVLSLEEMMQQAAEDPAVAVEPPEADEPPADQGRVMSMEEMMREAAQE